MANELDPDTIEVGSSRIPIGRASRAQLEQAYRQTRAAYPGNSRQIIRQREREAKILRALRKFKKPGQ